jgi:hypothetical protein
MRSLAAVFRQSLEQVVFVALLILMGLFLIWTLYISNHSVYLFIFVAFLLLNLLLRYATSSSHSYLLPVSELLSLMLRKPLESIRLRAILIAAFVLRFGWALAYRVTPQSDFLHFYQNALSFSKGRLSVLGVSKSPIAAIYYGTIIKLLDSSLISIYFVNAVLGCLQVWLVYKISYRLFRSEMCAKLSAVLIALFPSVVLYSGFISSEMPFATILLIILYIFSEFIITEEHVSRKKVFSCGMLLGLLTALLHLSRNVGVMMGFWILILVLFIQKVDSKKKLIFSAAYLLFLFAALMPQIRYNYKEFGVFSIQSSKWGPINLLMGTCKRSGGQYDVSEVRKVTSKVPFEGRTYGKASRYAFKLALKRIKDDPLDFIKFSLTKKYNNMWGNDSYSTKFRKDLSDNKMYQEMLKKYEEEKAAPNTRKSARPRLKRDFGILPSMQSWKARSNNYYFLILFLTLCSLLAVLTLKEQKQSRIFSMIAGVVLITVLMHLLIEVKSRYHFHCLFLFCILSGGILSTPTSLDSPKTIDKEPRDGT